MKRHLKRHGSKIAILTSLLGIVGLGMIFFNQNNKSNLTSAQVIATGCQTLQGWTPGFIPNGQSVDGYKNLEATYTETCSQLKGTLTCTDGSFGGNGNIYKYQTCTPKTRNNCTSPTQANHLQYKTLYKSNAGSPTQTCSSISKSFQCLDGNFAGTDISSYSYATCTDSTQGQCINTLTNTYVNSLQSIIVYQAAQSNNTQTCNDLKKQLTCINQQRSGGNPSSFNATCNDLNIKDCSFTGALGNNISLPNGQTSTYYSRILRSTTGLNYDGLDCSQYSGKVSCINGVIQGNTNLYKYTKQQCEGTQKDCMNQRDGGTIIAGDIVKGYSVTSTTFPDTCDNHSSQLRCVNGIIDGDTTTYKYNIGQCKESGGPNQPVDLILDIKTRSGLGISQYSTPTLKLSITNLGTDILTSSQVAEGFLSCDWIQGNNRINIYKSKALSSFTINPNRPIALSIIIEDTFTQALGQKDVECTINAGANYYTGEIFSDNNIRIGKINVIEAGRFDIAMTRAIEPIQKNLEAPEVIVKAGAGGAETIKNFIFKKVMDILVPLVVLIGILTSILGFYKLFFSTDEKSTSDGVKYITYGVIGIIIIMSAEFIGSSLYELLTPISGEIKGVDIAEGLYGDIVYPFLKLAVYLVLGVMFIILASRVVTFIFGTDEDAKKNAGTLIGRNIISMIIIIGAKQIVEAIYGKSQDVVKDVSNLGEIGTGILADKNIPIIYTVINRALGLASFIILVVIIVQTVSLLMNPDSPDQMKKIKNSLLYIFIGIIIIGTGYLLTNFLIIN